jgi:hypothetical protein
MISKQFGISSTVVVVVAIALAAIFAVPFASPAYTQGTTNDSAATPVNTTSSILTGADNATSGSSDTGYSNSSTP